MAAFNPEDWYFELYYDEVKFKNGDEKVILKLDERGHPIAHTEQHLALKEVFDQNMAEKQSEEPYAVSNPLELFPESWKSDPAFLKSIFQEALYASSEDSLEEQLRCIRGYEKDEYDKISALASFITGGRDSYTGLYDDLVFLVYYLFVPHSERYRVYGELESLKEAIFEKVIKSSEYRFFYGMILRTDSPIVKAMLGEVPLTPETFLEHLNPMISQHKEAIFGNALPRGEEDPNRYRIPADPKMVFGSWTKTQIREAIEATPGPIRNIIKLVPGFHKSNERNYKKMYYVAIYAKLHNIEL